jgi:hypothetical protein
MALENWSKGERPRLSSGARSYEAPREADSEAMGLAYIQSIMQAGVPPQIEQTQQGPVASQQC